MPPLLCIRQNIFLFPLRKLQRETMHSLAETVTNLNIVVSTYGAYKRKPQSSALRVTFVVKTFEYLRSVKWLFATVSNRKHPATCGYLYLSTLNIMQVAILQQII